MAVYINPNVARLATLGFTFKKAAQTPPNSGSTATLFTVATGSIYVTSLVGRVSTVLSGTTGAIALGTAPTTGTANTAGIATAGVVGGAEVGTKVSVGQSASGVAAALVVGGSKQAGGSPFLATPFIVDAGTITITTSVATMTGAIDWFLTWAPVDATLGASVS